MPWLAWLTPVVWKAICRTISVICVLAIVIGVPLVIHNHGYHKGYSLGYAKAVKDNPQTVITGDNASVTNNAESKLPFILFKVWKLRFSV